MLHIQLYNAQQTHTNEPKQALSHNNKQKKSNFANKTKKCNKKKIGNTKHNNQERHNSKLFSFLYQTHDIIT